MKVLYYFILATKVPRRSGPGGGLRPAFSSSNQDKHKTCKVEAVTSGEELVVVPCRSQAAGWFVLLSCEDFEEQKEW
jgi:hypothetical protein